MKRTALFTCLVLISLLVIGCAPIVRVNKFDDHIRSATSSRVQVFSNPNSIPYKYKEIALITVDDGGWGRSEQELLDIAILKAKDIGADGLLILSRENRRIVRTSAIVKTADINTLDTSSRQDPAINIAIADELKKLKQLLDDGVLTQEEFEIQKSKLLNR